MGTDQALQFAQRDPIRFIGRAIGLGAGGHHVRGAAQGDVVPGFHRNQHLPQNAGALGLALAVQVKGLGRVGRPLTSPRLALVQPAHQGLQQLPRIVEIALPQQGRALADQAVGAVGRHLVVGHHHAARRRHARLAAPAGSVGQTGQVNPSQGGMVAHEGAMVAPPQAAVTTTSRYMRSTSAGSHSLVPGDNKAAAPAAIA